MDVPRLQPFALQDSIDAVFEASHLRDGVADEPVAGGQIAVGGNAKVAGTCAAGIGPVRSTMDLAQRGHQIGECIGLTEQRAPLELRAAGDHAVQHGIETAGIHFA